MIQNLPVHRIWSIIINGKLSFFPVFSCEKHDIECQKLAKIVSYLQSLERKIYLAINDWIKGNGIRRRLSIGRESVANSNDAKVTSISRFKRRSIRKSRAWNFFFFPPTIEIEFSEFSNRRRFDLFHDVSVRRNFANF